MYSVLTLPRKTPPGDLKLPAFSGQVKPKAIALLSYAALLTVGMIAAVGINLVLTMIAAACAGLLLSVRLPRLTEKSYFCFTLLGASCLSLFYPWLAVSFGSLLIGVTWRYPGPAGLRRFFWLVAVCSIGVPLFLMVARSGLTLIL